MVFLFSLLDKLCKGFSGQDPPDLQGPQDLFQVKVWKAEGFSDLLGLTVIGQAEEMMRLCQDKAFNFAPSKLGVQGEKLLSVSALAFCQRRQFDGLLHTGNPAKPYLLSFQ